MRSIWTKLKSVLSGRCKKSASPLKAMLDQADATFEKAGSALEHMVTCHKMTVDRVHQMDQQLAELQANEREALNAGLSARAAELAAEIATLTTIRNSESKRADDFGASVEKLRDQLAKSEAQVASMRKL